jgi:transposase
MMTIKDVAIHLKVGWDCVKDIVKRNLHKLFSKPKLSHLRRLAIDEISVAKGHKYLTVVLDLESGQVVFVGDGKGGEALKPFWDQLKKSKAKISAISTDMSPAYVASVMENWHSASLVFDHFHVVKLMNEQLSELRRKLYREATDCQEKKVLKGSRWLLLKAPENLNEQRNERQRLQEALAVNEPLSKAYYLKEDLRQIWSQTDKVSAASVLDGWVKTALSSGIGPLIKMGRTLAKYRFGILNWYDHPISSGPLEGTNNKIKTLKRQAYGFRDLAFFKLRILGIHQAKYALTG